MPSLLFISLASLLLLLTTYICTHKIITTTTTTTASAATTTQTQTPCEYLQCPGPQWTWSGTRTLISINSDDPTFSQLPFLPAYYTHGPLNPPKIGATDEVELAILALHGLQRNADSFFCAMMASPTMQKDQGQKILVMAPRFQFQTDNCTGDLTTTLYWANSWSEGRASEEILGTDITVTSYLAIDTILSLLQNKTYFPALKAIHMVGFSDGGQATQRYALMSDDTATVNNTIPINFVVADPGSFAWMTGERQHYYEQASTTTAPTTPAPTTTAAPTTTQKPTTKKHEAPIIAIESYSSSSFDGDDDDDDDSSSSSTSSTSTGIAGPIFVTGGCAWDVVDPTKVGVDFCDGLIFNPTPFPSVDYCDDWNDWKYGVDGTQSGYVSHVDIDAALQRYGSQRSIYYLLGLQDVCMCAYNDSVVADADIPMYIQRNITGNTVNPTWCMQPNAAGGQDCMDNSFATGCEAMSQGTNRVQRSFNFYQHLRQYHVQNELELIHRRQLVAGVGHDHVAMYADPQVQTCLFGQWAFGCDDDVCDSPCGDVLLPPLAERKQQQQKQQKQQQRLR